MSNKNKLSYYFTNKSTSSHGTCESHHIDATDKDIINANEIIVLNELDNNSSTSLSSSTVTCFNQDSGNLNLNENRFITTTTNSAELLSESSLLNSFKRDPGRGPEAAGEFLLLGPYQPVTTFPTINHRHFCLYWYKGHCDDAFTKNGFNNWSMGVRKLNKYQSSISHKQANDSYVNAVKNHKDNMDVLKLIDIEHKKITLENRNYLIEIIRTIVFLAIPGLLFRGHRENDKSENKGNLLELLEFRRTENELIRKKLGALKYIHHSIQNEILSIIQQHILSQIVSEIKTSKYYSVMIDETSDISRHEQVSLVIRYTDDQFNVYERFIGFERASDISEEGLFDLLMLWLKKLDLDTKYIVGLCFDGASSMRGKCKGVATHLIQVIPTALYVHCNGHVLNLCLVDVSEVVVHVRNSFGVVKLLYKFIEGSPKRHKVFEDLQKELGFVLVPLKSLCDTRWTCRYESLKVIVIRYSEILSTLELIETGDSFILLQVIRTFDFVFHIHMMSEIYLITHILSKFLQHSNISLTDALAKVKVTIDSLQSLRDEHEFKRIWDESMKICIANNIDESQERRKRKVPLRFGGGDATTINSTIQDQYRDQSFYAVLDSIVASIKERFDENNLSVVILCEKLFLTKVFLIEDELKEVARFYHISYDDLRAEQRLYKIALDGKKE
ncbi:unnamed protein product [Rotaria sp. Silwood1]|nr:unnamed protein product [Rotaria sp. Silwood1]CAF4725819.1 unnamed protein product [Rotaria sp. Silwood1]CAF4804600.1 unnamed protein product [Rotaria sp. Silwood1]